MAINGRGPENLQRVAVVLGDNIVNPILITRRMKSASFVSTNGSVLDDQ